jgi:hypothetical protein
MAGDAYDNATTVHPHDVAPPRAPEVTPPSAAVPGGTTDAYDASSTTPPDTSADSSYSPWGWVGGPEREIAPLEAGGAIGAGVGALAGGVGAVPGAIIGAGTAGAVEGLEGLYDLGAYEFGLPKIPTGLSLRDVTEKTLDKAGVPKATTPGQRLLSTAVGTAADIASGTEGARALAPILREGGAARRFAEGTARNPVRQVFSGTVGAEAAQGARESGLVDDPVASTLLGMAAGRWSEPVLRSLVPGAPSAAAQAAHDAGYVLHPAEISTTNEGLPATALAAAGGKIKNWQHAQHLNMETTNRLAREDFRNPDGTPAFPPGTPFDHDHLEAVRERAAQEYERVADSLGGGTLQTRIPIITDTRVPHPDPRMGAGATQLQRTVDPNVIRRYHDAIDHLNDVDAEARAAFPEDMKNEEVEALQERMRNYNNFTPRAALGLIKQLRSDAKANFMARDKPKDLALGIARKRAADALEDLMDDQIGARTGDPNIMNRLRQARETIAKTWDYEYALRSDGSVDPSRLAALRRITKSGSRPKILTGNADTIANAYDAFPHNIKHPTGPDEQYSILDVYGAAIALASGHIPAAIGIALRSPARNIVASPLFQGWQFGAGDVLSRLGMPATAGRIPRTFGRTAQFGQGAQSMENGPLYPGYTGDSGYDAILGEHGR